MSVFVTYARENAEIVAMLKADLERARRTVWVDHDLTGGQQWWDEILRQIRSCDLYVFALSPSSLKSRACTRELEYAEALGRPLLPIMVSQVSIRQAPKAIADAQVVDYTARTAESVLEVRDALDQAPAPPPLPDPLPPPPDVPISYMGEYREKLAATTLTFEEQVGMFIQLKALYVNEDDRDDAADLLASLRRRPELATSVASDIDELVGSPTRGGSATDARSTAGRATGFADTTGGPSSPPPPPTAGGAAPVGTPSPRPSGRSTGKVLLIIGGAVILVTIGLAILGAIADCVDFGYC